MAFSLAGSGSFPSLRSDVVKVAQNGRCEGRFGARLRARETPAGSESGRVSRLPPPSRVQGAWPSYSPDRAASRGCASTQSKWPAKRPINRRFLPVVMTTLCHTPRWFLDSPQSDSGIHALQLRSVLCARVGRILRPSCVRRCPALMRSTLADAHLVADGTWP